MLSLNKHATGDMAASGVGGLTQVMSEPVLGSQVEDDDWDYSVLDADGWDSDLQSCEESFESDYDAESDPEEARPDGLQSKLTVTENELRRKFSSQRITKKPEEPEGNPKENLKILLDRDFWDEISPGLDDSQLLYHDKDGQKIVARGTPNRLIAHMLCEVHAQLVAGAEPDKAVGWLSFGHVFLVTFIWWTTAPILMQKLLQVYNGAGRKDKPIPGFIPCDAVEPAVCAVITNWMRLRPTDFQLPEVDELWKRFISQVTSDRLEMVLSDPNLLTQIDNGCILPPALEATKKYRTRVDLETPLPPVAPPEPEEPEGAGEGPEATAEREDENSRRVFGVLDSKPKYLAQQLSLMDHEIYTSINLEEFRSKGWLKTRDGENLRLSPNIYRSIKYFNDVTLWVTALVLKSDSPAVRAQYLTRFIRLADKLVQMRSYNTLMAVHSALNHVTIQRMKLTLEKLDKKTRDMMEGLNEILSPDNNYKGYRSRLQTAVPNEMCIPYLGVILRDLTFMDDAQVSVHGDGTVNFRKMLMLGETFAPVCHYQLSPPPFAVNKEMQSLMRCMLRPVYTADQLYDMSLVLEPKKKTGDAADNGNRSTSVRRVKEPPPPKVQEVTYEQLYGDRPAQRGKTASFFGVADAPRSMPTKASKFFGQAPAADQPRQDSTRRPQRLQPLHSYSLDDKVQQAPGEEGPGEIGMFGGFSRVSLNERRRTVGASHQPSRKGSTATRPERAQSLSVKGSRDQTLTPPQIQLSESLFLSPLAPQRSPGVSPSPSPLSPNPPPSLASPSVSPGGPRTQGDRPPRMPEKAHKFFGDMGVVAAPAKKSSPMDRMTKRLALKKSPSREANSMLPRELQKTMSCYDGAGGADYARIDRELDDMVDSIFTLIDEDKDGVIDHGEFENLITNFPFIQMRDLGPDVVLTRQGLKGLFRMANNTALDNMRSALQAGEAAACPTCGAMITNGLDSSANLQQTQCQSCSSNGTLQAPSSATSLLSDGDLAPGGRKRLGRVLAKNTPQEELMTSVGEEGFAIRGGTWAPNGSQ